MPDRRKFISTLFRGTILGSLTALSGVLIHRWSEAEDCRQNYSCGRCSLSGQCRLPEADQHRLEKARMNKNDSGDGSAGK
jgi:hypothetical protein